MTRPELPIKVLVPDGEHFYLQRVITCFADSGGVELYVMSGRKYITMRFSRHVHTYIHFPGPRKDSKWIEKINEVCTKYGIDVLMPVYTDVIRILIAKRDKLTTKVRTLIPESVEIFDTANDKGRLAVHMQSIGVPGPKSVVLNNGGDLKKVTGYLNFPVLAKPPLQSGGGLGILKFNDEVQLRNAELNYPVVLQEFIEGYDLGCNILCRDGEILAYTIQRGFLYQNKPFSPQEGLITVHDDKVLEVIRPLVGSLRWTGVANIDLIYDQKAGECKVLEINPRYWLTLNASMMAGVNFPWLYCLAALGYAFPPPEYRDMRFLTLKGMVIAIRKDVKLLLKLNLLWRETPLKYALRDPAPMVYHYFWRTKNILVNRWQKAVRGRG